jgi:hypothetical protein
MIGGSSKGHDSRLFMLNDLHIRIPSSMGAALTAKLESEELRYRGLIGLEKLELEALGLVYLGLFVGLLL